MLEVEKRVKAQGEKSRGRKRVEAQESSLKD